MKKKKKKTWVYFGKSVEYAGSQPKSMLCEDAVDQRLLGTTPLAQHPPSPPTSKLRWTEQARFECDIRHFRVAANI